MKVIAIFTILVILAILLGFWSYMHNGSITGNIVNSKGYSEELFVGNDYDFKFYPDRISLEDNSIIVKGNLNELTGREYKVNIIAYVFDSESNIIGEYEEEVFLAGKDSLLLGFSVSYSTNNKIKDIAIYFENSDTIVKGSYVFSNVLISARTIEETYKNESGKMLLTFIVVAGLLLGILGIHRSYKRNKREMHFVDTINSNTSRKFIDLDIR